MNNTCIILVLSFAFISCALSSYLDIPPPPERPLRFKTKEQIENYLKAVKDYYDAFKIKLVRRENLINTNMNPLPNNDHMEDLDEQLHIFEKLYDSYKQKQQSNRNIFRRRETNIVT